MSDRTGTAGHTVNEEDSRIVSELVDDIRDAVIEYQVSGNLEPLLQSRIETTELGGSPIERRLGSFWVNLKEANLYVSKPNRRF